MGLVAPWHVGSSQNLHWQVNSLPLSHQGSQPGPVISQGLAAPFLFLNLSCLEKGGECALQINNVILVTNCCTETPTVEWAFPPGGEVSEREEGSF